MAGWLDRRKAAWIALSAVAVSAAYLMYAQGYFDWWLGEWASGAGKFNPAMCSRAGIAIESVECADKVVRIALSNTGRVPLNGNFIAVVSTHTMQAFVANNTESVMRPGQTGKLALELGDLADPVWKVTVTFQPCKSVVAEKEGLLTVC